MTQHVCIVSNTLADGGAERWASNTCDYLAGDPGFKVSLVLFRNDKTYPCPDSVSIRALNHRYFVHTFRTLRRLRRILIEDQVDVVISNGAYTGQFVGQAVAKTKTRWIARISGNIAQGQQNLLQRLGWRWLDRNIHHATAIVANSRSMATEVQSRWPAMAERISSIPNGLNVDRLRTTESQQSGLQNADFIRRPFVLGAGRLHPQKRPDVFIQMLAHLKSTTQIFAYWCGDGALRPEIERLINQTGMSEDVKLLPFRSDLPVFMKSADCFVLTSDHEGSPNVLAEAMAIGIPVVSTNCDHGPGELLADHRGWLAPVGDAVKIAEAVSEVLSNPEEAQRRASKAQTWVRENLDLASIGVRWKELIQQVCTSSASPCELPSGRTS